MESSILCLTKLTNFLGFKTLLNMQSKRRIIIYNNNRLEFKGDTKPHKTKIILIFINSFNCKSLNFHKLESRLTYLICLMTNKVYIISNAHLACVSLFSYSSGINNMIIRIDFSKKNQNLFHAQ